MPAPKKNKVIKYIAKEVAKKITKKPVVKVQPKPNLKASPKSNVKVIPTGPLSPRQAEAKRIAQAKLRMMEINKKNPSWTDPYDKSAYEKSRSVAPRKPKK